MSEFNTEDRDMLRDTNILLKAHVEQSDERHSEIKERLHKNESAIGKNTAFRNWMLGIFTTGASGTGLVAGVKHFFGGG